MSFNFLKLRQTISFGVILSKVLLSVFAVVYIFACGTVYAADTVGSVDPQRVMFQHPSFSGASRLLIFLSRPLEGTDSQILTGGDPELREMTMMHSRHVMALAELDRAISAENNPDRRAELWRNRQIRLSEFETYLMRPILEDYRRAVRAVMTSRQISIVLDQNSVFYGGTEITDDVIQYLLQSARP